MWLPCSNLSLSLRSSSRSSPFCPQNDLPLEGLHHSFHKPLRIASYPEVREGLWIVSFTRAGLCVSVHLFIVPDTLSQVLKPIKLLWSETERSSFITSPVAHMKRGACCCLMLLAVCLFSWITGKNYLKESFCPCCSVARSCLTLRDPTDRSSPGFPVQYLPEFAHTHVHWVGDAIQPSHPLLPLSPALNLSQHQRLLPIKAETSRPSPRLTGWWGEVAILLCPKLVPCHECCNEVHKTQDSRTFKAYHQGAPVAITKSGHCSFAGVFVCLCSLLFPPWRFWHLVQASSDELADWNIRFILYQGKPEHD